VQILIFNTFFKTYRNICANAAMAGKARRIWEMAFSNYEYLRATDEAWSALDGKRSAHALQ
jgi:hypothetical protein